MCVRDNMSSPPSCPGVTQHLFSLTSSGVVVRFFGHFGPRTLLPDPEFAPNSDPPSRSRYNTWPIMKIRSKRSHFGHFGPRIPDGTTRAPFVWLCGQFTVHTSRTVKKNEKKNFVHFHPSFPHVHGRGPTSPKLIFFRQKKI